MTEKYVKIVCDYSFDPVCDRENVLMNVEDDLPISRALKLALEVWCEWYEFNDADGGQRSYSGQFPTIHESNSHSKMGFKLAKEIKKELPDWTVVYLDDYNLHSEMYITRNKCDDRSYFEYEITSSDMSPRPNPRPS